MDLYRRNLRKICLDMEMLNERKSEIEARLRDKRDGLTKMEEIQVTVEAEQVKLTERLHELMVEHTRNKKESLRTNVEMKNLQQQLKENEHRVRLVLAELYREQSKYQALRMFDELQKGEPVTSDPVDSTIQALVDTTFGKSPRETRSVTSTESTPPPLSTRLNQIVRTQRPLSFQRDDGAAAAAGTVAKRLRFSPGEEDFRD